MNEGFVSRYFNRRFSHPLAAWLTRTPVTPNQMSVASFAVASGAAAAFVAGVPALGGVLAQTSSILDGTDGDLARMQGTATRFGAFFDAVLDRYADAAIILGMVLSAQQSYAEAWLVGLAALLGSFMVSYTRARSETSVGVRFQTGPAALATRDVRLALICLGALCGEIFWTLVVLAVLTHAVVFARVLLAYRRSAK